MQSRGGVVQVRKLTAIALIVSKVQISCDPIDQVFEQLLRKSRMKGFAMQMDENSRSTYGGWVEHVLCIIRGRHI